MYHNNNYAIACLSHDKSKTCNLIGLREFKTADSAHTRNRAIVTRGLLNKAALWPMAFGLAAL